MIRIVRAAGFAAAALACIASATFSAPLLAQELKPVAALAEATVAAAEAGVTASAAAPTEQGAVAKVLVKAAEWIAGKDDKPEAAAKPVLADLVSKHAYAALPDAEQECLANAVYFEARGESIEGQLAVAEVVLNRAASGRYPPNICKVVTQPAQFSFIRRGQFPRADRSSEAWRKAVAIAHIARAQLADSLAPNVLWYHATYVSPSWGKRLTRQAKIGLHIFYS